MFVDPTTPNIFSTFCCNPSQISISRSTWASGGEEWDVPAVEEESTCHHKMSVGKIHVAGAGIALGLEVVFRKPGMVHIISTRTIIVECCGQLNKGGLAAF